MKYKEKHHKNCPNRNSNSKSDSKSFSDPMLHFLSLDSLLGVELDCPSDLPPSSRTSDHCESPGLKITALLSDCAR